MRDTLTPRPCATCRTGCDCDALAGHPACGHHGCWGRAADGPTDPCPGAVYEVARLAALAARRDLQSRRAARTRTRLATVHAAILRRHGLVPTA